MQGVGFRPHVYMLARQFGLTGTVNNTLDGVHVEVNGPREYVHRFYRALIDRAPRLSGITRHRIGRVESRYFPDFRIISSASSGVAKLLITPDFALCDACSADLHREGNRRKDYAFTTCTHCGPRYSVISRLPYDRENTAMGPFEMCPVCSKEYNDPLDRRYYAQINSCPACGVTLALWGQDDRPLETPQDEIPATVARLWTAGGIVAIKGIGGYLLTCDAANERAVSLLRERKHRPSKPFALMYPGVDALKRDLAPTGAELTELTSPAAPIVLVEKARKTQVSTAFDAIAPGLDLIGVMLPYTPLYELLLDAFGKPIVATSGNVSNAPIVYRDDKALEELRQIAGHVLVNNREIVIPQDDSVIRFTSFTRQRIVLRRSRGFAPNYAGKNPDLPQDCILAAGAMLKSTFTYFHRGNTFVSQYLGDLEAFDAQEHYRHTAQHFFQLFNTLPELILTDKHPGYPSTEYGLQLAADLEVPAEQVQHHIAHFAAVLAENDLTACSEPVLGVIWDGTGLGDDGQIWGGEFFQYEESVFRRCGQFEYFGFILGDKMPKEPRISALAACHGLPEAEDLLAPKFTRREWDLYRRMLANENALKTSSVGRIFDAVASLLGLMDRQTFEGEAASQLERLAEGYCKRNGLHFDAGYFAEGSAFPVAPTRILMNGIIRDLLKGEPKDLIAARFHYSLVQLIEAAAVRQGINKIAFSGGGFQNSLLVDLIIFHLDTRVDLYFHRELSPNDECVSFGQLIWYQIRTGRESIIQDKTDNHVFSDSR